MNTRRFFFRLIVLWWPLMAVHEGGHVLGALVAGARIERVVLWPWTISETVRLGSKAPWLDTWAGPVAGMLLPLLVYLWIRRTSTPGVRGWLACFAGFCLVANGLYLGVGWLDRAGDAGDLLRQGVTPWQLTLVGGVAVAAGLWIWHKEPLSVAKSA